MFQHSTSKVYIAVTHFPEYIAKTKLALGQTSDQVLEATDQHTNKILMGSILGGLHHINTYNTLTR